MSEYNPSGLDLSRITERLNPVDGQFNDCPIEHCLAMDGGDYAKVWDRWFPHNECRLGWSGDVWKSGSSLLPEEVGNLSFDRKVRIWESTVISTDWAYQASYEENPAIQSSVFRVRNPVFDPNWRVFGKVGSSVWRWSCKKDFNTSVHAFNAIPNFRPDGFEVLFDHASHHNERGYAAYNRNHFYDGPLAYVLHWKGKPVAVTSFAIMKGMKLGITQVQMINRKGNRFLYKVDLKESILDAYRAAFVGFEVCLVTGDSLARSIEKQYRNCLSDVVKRKSYDSDSEARRQKQMCQIKGLLDDFSSVKDRIVETYAQESERSFRSCGYTFTPQ